MIKKLAPPDTKTPDNIQGKKPVKKLAGRKAGSPELQPQAKPAPAGPPPFLTPKEAEEQFEASREAAKFLAECYRFSQERHGVVGERRFIRQEYGRILGKFLAGDAPRSLAKAHIYYRLLADGAAKAGITIKHRYPQNAKAAAALSWKYTDYSEHLGEAGRLLDSAGIEPGQPGVEGDPMKAKKVHKVSKNVAAPFRGRIMMFGKPVTSVIRTLAAMELKLETSEIRELAKSLGVKVADGTVSIQASRGRAGKPGAELSATDIHSVNAFVAKLRKAGAKEQAAKAPAKKAPPVAKKSPPVKVTKVAPKGKKLLPPPKAHPVKAPATKK